MFGDPPRALPQKIGFLLIPRYSLLGFSSALEPLRLANTLSGRQLYEWQVISADGAPVVASNRMSLIADCSIAEADPCPIVVVCASYEPLAGAAKPVLAWLRRLSRRGVDLGALDTGSFVLARAGLLDGYTATVHWETVDSFTERFPDVTVTQDIFEVDRDRFSCSGATAALDMMLQLIRKQHGYRLATAVSEEIIHHPIREASNPQRMALGLRLGTRDRRVTRAVDSMERNLEEPLPISRIAETAGLSERQLERLFRRDLKTTPGAYYARLKLERARNLLRQTMTPIIEIAISSGFGSAAAFSRAYRAQFGISPSRDRADT